MKRLLLIVALALMSGACASAPQYHAVLIPPMSTTEPAILTAATPRPPAGHPDEDVINDLTVECPPELNCDPKLTVTKTPRPPVAPTVNNLKGKLNLNKGLAPYVKLDWSAGSKQVATAPVAIAKSASVRPEELKEQINNLLAQVDSLQSVANDRRPSKLERYARELGVTKAELKAAQAERDKALDEIVLLKQSEAIAQTKLAKVRELFAAARKGSMQWRAFTLGQSQDKQADLRDWVIGGTLSLLTLVAFVFALGWRNGKIKAEGVASARITALKDANEGKNLYITELRGNLAKKGNHIAELEMMLKEERRTYRNRIQELKRQRAGPLPETVDDDLSPESVFGPLERDDEQKE